MFDIISASSNTVLVNSIDFRHTYTQLSTVTIYTAKNDGSYIDKSTLPNEWMIIKTMNVKIGQTKGDYVSVRFDTPVEIAAGTTRAFYIASTGKLISGYYEQGDTIIMDTTLKVKAPARIVGTLFGGGSSGSW